MIYYARLSRFPKVFQSMTGLRVAEFDQLLDDLAEPYGQAEQKRLSRPKRQRALGGGPDFALAYRDQVLLTVIWLRLYPTHEVLAFLFGERLDRLAVYCPAPAIVGSQRTRYDANARSGQETSPGAGRAVASGPRVECGH